MREKKVGAIAIRSFALLVVLGTAYQAMAQDAKTPYGNMAPIEQYLMTDQGAENARSLRAQRGGKVLVTDGPYIETKEHIGGFWVLEAADLDEALAWGPKAAVACRASVEVRAFNWRRTRRKQLNSLAAETSEHAP